MPTDNSERSTYIEGQTEWRVAEIPNMELRELLQFRSIIRGQMTGVSDHSTHDELDAEDRRLRDVKYLDIEIEKRQQDQNSDRLAELHRRPAPPVGAGPQGLNGFRNVSPADDAETRGVLLRTTGGREVRALPREVSLLSNTRDASGADYTGEPPSIGRSIVGMVTGDWSGAEREYRTMITSNAAAGGFLLNPILSSAVIDLARNASSIMQAGAMTIPMTSQELSIAKVVSDPTGHWRREGARIPVSEMSFELFRLRARTLAAVVPVTIEMLEDAENASSLIERALQAALALEVDRAGLRGEGGTEEPVGLRYADGVNETTGVGSPDYDDIIDAITDIETANGMPNAWLLSPREAGTFAKLKDDQSQYLQPPEAVKGLRRIVSNQIPTDLGGGSNESEMYVGDFSQVIVGARTAVRIEVLADGAFVDSAGEVNYAGQELKALVRAYLRADVGFIRPTHFTRLLGVTAS